MSYEVEILDRAKADYRRIYQYIAKRSQQGAERWDEALDDALGRLQEDPLGCGQAPETPRLSEPVRQLLFRTKQGRVYRAVFKIDGGKVAVLRFRGPGQRPITNRDLPP